MGKFTQSVLAVSLEPKVEPIKLVEKGTIKINSNDTSTTATKIKDCSFDLKDHCIYYFVCKKSQTPTSGLESNEVITSTYYASNAATALSGAITGIKTMYSDGAPTKTQNSGIGIYTIVSSGKMSITKKYNATSTANWFGVYDYKIYEIDLSKLGE